MSKMRVLVITCGIVVCLMIGFSITMRIVVKKELQECKPYITYTRLMGVASVCDKYKDQFGVWPNSLSQLRTFRPELSDWAKDAWGKGDNVWGSDVVLVPYSGTLGYGEVISYGRDGKPGGTGFDSDLVVRFPTGANVAWNKQQGEGLKKPKRAP